MEKTISVRCEEARVTGYSGGRVETELINADADELLDSFSVKEVVDYFEEQRILDHIGKDRVMEYFELVEILDS